MAKRFYPAEMTPVEMAKKLQGIGYSTFNLTRSIYGNLSGIREDLRILANQSALIFNELIRRAGE